MFVDTKELRLSAGRGGDGVVLFRREIYVPKGGPDGGDGGRGGDVILKGRRNLHALTHLARTDKIEAQNGVSGSHQRSTGKSGSHEIVDVPLGTVVKTKDLDGTWKELVELLDEGQEYRIAKGGNGGWGNWHFKSSVQQAPDHANPGQEGENFFVRLELKIIADVGLIGLPNAGKSTLLSVVTAAKPKIADYPFTTLEPQLGVAEVGQGADAQQIVIADLPGLIEGASGGKGLGSEFLRHIERTRTVLHCLDAGVEFDQLLTNYQIVRSELNQWSTALAEKPEKIVLTKTDTVDADDLKVRREKLENALGKPVVTISAATHTGIKELLTGLI